ncbi:MAG: transposase [Planctomycetota bacterium]
MRPQPIYTTDKINSAYCLRYVWTGWPKNGSTFPSEPSTEFFDSLDKAWQEDGLRIVSVNWRSDRIQIAFSAVPHVAPTLFVGRVKGRLQHALRKVVIPAVFSRKVAFRAIGNNHSEEIERYLSKQVDRERFVDSEFAELLEGFTHIGDVKRFRKPLTSVSGRYWYNLHIVLVTSGRGKIDSLNTLRKLDRSFEATANKHGYDLVMRSWLLDHVHVALRGNIEQSPQEIALSLMNNSAYTFGQNAVWQFGFYAGSFSEYDVNAVRS